MWVSNFRKPKVLLGAAEAASRSQNSERTKDKTLLSFTECIAESKGEEGAISKSSSAEEALTKLSLAN